MSDRMRTEQGAEFVLSRSAGETSSSATLHTQRIAPTLWTPRFIVVFGLVLILGLDCVIFLTVGWPNDEQNAPWIMLGWTLVNAASWLAISLRAQSLSMRLVGLTGTCWAIVHYLSFLSAVLSVSSPGSVSVYASAAAACALLVCSLLFFYRNAQYSRWDTFLYIAAAVFSILAILLVYLLTPVARTPSLLATGVAVAGYICIVAIWWLRPQCWLYTPSLTVLFGLAALFSIFLLFNTTHSENSLLFAQASYLCLTLAALRCLRGERM